MATSSRRLDGRDAEGEANRPAFFDEQAQQPQHHDNGAKAPNIAALAGKFAVTQDNASAAQQYIDQLRQLFTINDSKKYEIVRLNPAMLSFCIAVVRGTNAVILAFEDGVIGTDDMPVSRFDGSAYDELRRIRPDVALLKFIVVTKEDYEKYQQMYRYICNLFDVASNTDTSNQITSEYFKNMKITYQFDAETYKRMIDRYNPHAVPLRHDLMLVMSVGEDNDNKNFIDDEGYYSGIRQINTPLVAIGGYVDFVLIDRNKMQFLPLVHISEITSVIPSSSLMPMILALAAKKFVDEGTWWFQYSRFDNKMNVGNLIPDPTGNSGRPGNRWACQNQTDFDRFGHDCMNKPLLVLDVTQGRASLAGLEMYAVDAKNGRMSVIYDAFSKFANVDFSSQETGDQLSLAVPFFRGIFNFKDGMYDTAHIDYLMEYAKRPAQFADFETLLTKKRSLRERMVEIKKIESTARMLYRTDVVVLPNHLIADIAKNLTGLRINTSFNDAVDFSGLARYANASAQFGGTSYSNTSTPYSAFFR